MYGDPQQTVMCNALGETTDGNHSMNNTPTQQQYNRAQPLKLCDVCNSRYESVGGVMVREKWYCAKCWTRFINRK
jgi:hypothetical protein